MASDYTMFLIFAIISVLILIVVIFLDSTYKKDIVEIPKSDINSPENESDMRKLYLEENKETKKD